MAALAACGPAPEPPKKVVPQVTVAPAVQTSVPVYLDYVGTLQATQEVEIRARVKGYLVQRAFQDGADVKEGDLLFLIDPREYEAELARAQAQLARDKASLTYAQSQVRRYGPLTAQDLTPKDTLENFQSLAKEREAAVKAGEAAVKLARLNLGYTTVKAPISGRIGRRLVDAGNLVGAGEETLLATIMQMDPIYVYFSPSERRISQIMGHRKLGNPRVQINLSDGSVYPHLGKLDFINNKVDPATGTITMRAVLANADKRLVPGQYVNVRLLLAEIPDALVVLQKAVGADQAGSYVFVVGPDRIVQQRYVETGPRHEDGYLVIDKGLKAGELVVVEGIQKVRQGLEVEPQTASPARNAEPGKALRDKNGAP
jgi:RND family efflux transporter MFP subunit